LLYQVAAGILPEGLIAPALRSVIRKQTNARTLLADVKDVDVNGGVVSAVTPDGRKLTLRYDTLVVDGQHYGLNQTWTINNTSWPDMVGIQYQLDQDSTGAPIHEWVDNVKLTMW